MFQLLLLIDFPAENLILEFFEFSRKLTKREADVERTIDGLFIFTRRKKMNERIEAWDLEVDVFGPTIFLRRPSFRVTNNLFYL